MLRPSFLLPALTLEGIPCLAWRVGKLGGAHPLPPPMLQHFLGEIACRHGRGIIFYNLIPKGGVAPFGNPLLRAAPPEGEPCRGAPSSPAGWAGFAVPAPASPGAWASLAVPTPCPLPRPYLGDICFLAGAGGGDSYYSLIPKGGADAPPFDNPPDIAFCVRGSYLLWGCKGAVAPLHPF